MNRKITCCALVATFLLVVMVFQILGLKTEQTDQSAQEVLSTLIGIVKGQLKLANSQDFDYVDENVVKLYLTNERTLNYLADALESASIEETTGTALSAWPTPAYYIGDIEVGGYHCFFIVLQDRNFLIHLEGEKAEYFWMYIDKVIEAGALPGIK